MSNDILNSKDTEISILGSVLYQPEMFSRVYSGVKSEDFYYPVHRTVFDVMAKLYANKLDINVKTVWNELYKSGYTGVTESELSDFMDYRVPVEAALSFASQVSEFSGYRLLQKEIEGISPAIKTRSKDLMDLASELSNLAKRIASKGVSSEFKTGDALLEAYLEMIRRPRSDKQLTGVEKIDKELYDFDAKEITLIAARPGTGKTALMLQSVRKNLELGSKVGFLSMEMDNSKLTARLISGLAGINGKILRNMSEDEQLSDANILGALKWIHEMPLFIDDAGPFNSHTVPQKIRKMVYEHGCNLIYVDYIGLIQAAGGLVSANRNDQLSHISGSLKGLASELDIPIVAAAQLNRESTKTVTGRPTLANLRDSGALEQDASLVIFLYPDVEKMMMGGLTQEDAEEYIEGQDRLNIKLEIAKQRNGSNFVENIIFDKPYGRFYLPSDLHRSY